MLNKVCLIGNVGSNPEIRTTQNGKEIANLSIATSESWKDKNTGERKTKTEWHKVAVFNEGLVRIIKSYIKKGSKLYIEGALQTRKWTDASGNEKYTTEVVLQGFGGVITMLDSREGGSAVSEPDYAPNDLDDEIPFMWIGLGLAVLPILASGGLA